MATIKCGTAVGGRYGITAGNIAAVAEAGIERVEIPFAERHFRYRSEIAVADAAGALAAAGLECRSVHLGFEDDYDISSADEGLRRATLDDMIYGLSVAPLLGAGIAVVHGSSEPISDAQRADRIAVLGESLIELSTAAAENGMRLALELLPRTCLGHTSSEALAIVEGLDEAVVGFCVDVNHVNLREDPAAVVRSLGARILTFHISDNDGVNERHWFPFEGVIDWRALMGAVREVGYEGQFIFETGGSMKDDPREYLAELRARFDRLMAL